MVFLTNGDAYPEAVSIWLKKKPEDLIPEDYLAFGKQRQEEAIRAVKKLGLNEEGIIFLSYPDKGLSSIWENSENLDYESETTRKSRSSYQRTYNLARSGYNRENLIQDIKNILTQYKPKIIYAPSPLDSHSDHAVAANFLNKALGELRLQDWLGPSKVFYYVVYSNVDLNCPDYFFQGRHKEIVASFKSQKKEALEEYQTQLDVEEAKKLFSSSLSDEELFWEVPSQKRAYLNKVYDAWRKVSKTMKGSGYNVNLGLVTDVADDIDDFEIDLVKKQKIFSDDPEVVFQLAYRIAEAMNSQGITPVAKHFPGLGSVRCDTHKCLPLEEIPLDKLYKRDILPFKKLIEKGAPLWIMTSHAIYPCLDDKPASLSYKIQTELLRKKIGFKGMIVSDELLGMQAIEGYALKQGIKKPYIGEIAVMAFNAGTDIVIIYPEPEKSEEAISIVIKAAAKAVKEGRMKEKDIDSSVEKILMEKERIFNKPLRYLLKDMAFAEKISQKIIIDIYKENIGILDKYNLGGLHIRDHQLIRTAQDSSKIPLFIVGQHEGGRVNESGLGIYTQSAYLTGREFERTFKQRAKKSLSGERKKNPLDILREPFFDFSMLNTKEQQKIIDVLCDTVDAHINFYLGIKKGADSSLVNPDYFSPLSMTSDITIRPRMEPFEALPLAWLSRFTDKETALSAYKVFKKAFDRWQNKISESLDRKRFGDYIDQRLYELKLLKEEIRGSKGQVDTENMRVLCLAAHPDDEDVLGLIYFREKFNAQTYVLLATRGQAGENLIGSSLYEDLGFLRTEEMEKAAHLLGVKKCFYLGKTDFGYCFETEEALKKWGAEDTLSRLVYFYRLIRPHIIITKHNKFNDEHCQHKALVVLAEKAFELSSDPAAYPEMIKEGLLPWRPTRFYQRSSGNKSFPLEDIVINAQEIIGPENRTYQEAATEALSQHRSQIGLANGLVEDKIAYELIKANTFFKQNLTAKKEKDSILWKRGEVSPSGLPGVKIVNGVKVGLLEENSNAFFIALKTLGCDVERIDAKSIEEGGLSSYDTVILSKGADKVLTVTKDMDKRLLEFVEKGGNLAVFLQEAGQMDAFSFFPHPFNVFFDPIVDADSPVTILAKRHLLFNFPNRISSADFKGWKQERALFFCQHYSDKYTELTACPDRKSELIKGGYLSAQYGAGAYILTTYSWQRQLREFHIGAYKNLANILSYPYANKLKSGQQKGCGK